MGDDGLRYSLKTSKLFIPQKWRDIILYWFHNSPGGGHCGANRTSRRMKNWVWWPNQRQDIQQYTKQCLVCLRGASRVVKTMRGMLTKPVAMQLISLDYVGPRTVGQETWHYLVIIDHATQIHAHVPYSQYFSQAR